MKVKIGDKIYDSSKEPIMVILTEQDKKNIKRMCPKCTQYCVYPQNKMTEKEAISWMRFPVNDNENNES